MIAEVWQREQNKMHEEKRLEEMRKEIAEERKLQELQMQAAEAGHIDKVERLEFMYRGGPMMSTAEKTQEEEAYLLGEKRYQPPKEEDEFAKTAAAPGAKLADAPAARNETWNKLNADPLLMMRMQEQEMRKNIMHNPVKMAQIQKEVAELREKKKARKEAKKEAKREKKEERKRAIREEVRRKVLGEEAHATAKLREEGKRKRSERSDYSSSSGSPVRRGRPHSHSRSPMRPRDCGDERRGGHVRRYYHGDRDDYKRRRDDSRNRRRSRSRSVDRYGDRSRRDRHLQEGSDGRNDARDHRRDHIHVDGRGEERRDRGRDEMPAGPSREGSAKGEHRNKGTGVQDGASAQDGSKGYGLTYANQRAEDAAAVRRERRNEWRESTREEREAAEEAERKAKEAAWAKTGGKNSVGHRTGRLTAEEKAARLKAMISDADVHDEARWSRLRKDAVDEAAGGEKSLVELSVGAPTRHHSEVAPFLEAAQRKAFGGGGADEGGGLEDRIGVRKYYTHSGGDDGNSYKR